MKGGVRGRREFRQNLIEQVIKFQEIHGYKSVNALINEAIEKLPESRETIELVKRGSLNMRISPENMDKIQRIAEASKVQIGKRTLGGNETAVIALALEKIVESIEE